MTRLDVIIRLSEESMEGSDLSVFAFAIFAKTFVKLLAKIFIIFVNFC